jgi:hypothetical protein
VNIGLLRFFAPAAVPSRTGVAFDVLVCPLANYFKDQGVPELTEPAAGNLDYRMAREWGVELVRTNHRGWRCALRLQIQIPGEQSFNVY